MNQRSSHLFQSPQPSRAVTLLLADGLGNLHISIPTALAGCDNATIMGKVWLNDFNPHSPRGL